MPVQIPSPTSRKHARIEIIPLIDIIFFLLATFVMVSLSMVKNKGIPVHLPVAASGTPQERKDFATITVTAGGEIYFDKQPISVEALDPALRGLLATNPEPRVFINGDAKAEFGKAIEVLDHVRKAGITKIAIETRAPVAAPGAAAPAAGDAIPGAPAPGAAIPAPAAPPSLETPAPPAPPQPAAPATPSPGTPAVNPGNP